MDWQLFFDTIIGWLANTGVKVVVALLALFISYRVITVLSRRIEKRLIGGRHKVDKTLTKTLVYVLSVSLKVLILICLIGYLGIDTSGLTALIASLGVCFGLAVNGAVSNIAGGVLILVTRPFRVDDVIEVDGFTGTVEDIRITHTKIRLEEKKVVFIPNGKLASASVINRSI